MKKAIKYQWNLMLSSRNFKISFLLVMFYCIASFVYMEILPSNAEMYSNLSADAVYAGGPSALWGYFEVIFPFLTVLPFSLSYINDRECGVFPLIFSREEPKIYFLSKTVVCFCGSAITILIPFVFNLMLCHIALPTGYNYPFGSYGDPNFNNLLTGDALIFETKFKAFPFLKLFLHSPTVYTMLYILLLSLFAGLLGMFALCLSYVIKKYRVLLFLPGFILFRASSLLEQLSYNNAIDNPARNYTNFYIMNYLGPITYTGQSPLYIAAIITCLLACSAIFCAVAIRRDELLNGGRRVNS